MFAIIRMLVVCTIVVVTVATAFLIYPQYQHRETARTTYLKACQDCEQLKVDFEAKRRFGVGLVSSPAIIEKVARERFGYSLPSEQIIKMVDPQSEI